MLLLQAVARGMRDRKRVRGMRAAVLQLQAAVRSAWSAHYRAALAAQAAERDAQRSQNRLDNAALCIQCAWRRHGAVQELARRRAVRNREILTVLQAEREAAALTLQTAQRRKYAQALIKIRKDEYQDRLAAVRHAEAQGYIGRMWKMHVAQEVLPVPLPSRLSLSFRLQLRCWAPAPPPPLCGTPPKIRTQRNGLHGLLDRLPQRCPVSCCSPFACCLPPVALIHWRLRVARRACRVLGPRRGPERTCPLLLRVPLCLVACLLRATGWWW